MPFAPSSVLVNTPQIPTTESSRYAPIDRDVYCSLRPECHGHLGKRRIPRCVFFVLKGELLASRLEAIAIRFFLKREQSLLRWFITENLGICSGNAVACALRSFKLLGSSVGIATSSMEACPNKNRKTNTAHRELSRKDLLRRATMDCELVIIDGSLRQNNIK